MRWQRLRAPSVYNTGEELYEDALVKVQSQTRRGLKFISLCVPPLNRNVPAVVMSDLSHHLSDQPPPSQPMSGPHGGIYPQDRRTSIPNPPVESNQRRLSGVCFEILDYKKPPAKIMQTSQYKHKLNSTICLNGQQSGCKYLLYITNLFVYSTINLQIRTLNLQNRVFNRTKSQHSDNGEQFKSYSSLSFISTLCVRCVKCT